MSDIAELIRADHQRIRCARQALLGLAGEHGGSVRGRALAVWADLAGLIEVHAGAGEEICHLPRCGHTPAGWP